MMTSCIPYHDSTSYERERMIPHYLDWENQPELFKTYPGTEKISLPREGPFPNTTLFHTLHQQEATTDSPIDIRALSTILMLTYTLTAKARHGSGDFYFRSVPSAGALYPVELYVATEDVEGLDDGLYHFSAGWHGLHVLKKGRIGRLARPFVRPEEERLPAITFFFTCILFRTCWKYRTRGYRYCLLDAGHVLENAALALKSMKLECTCSHQFDDQKLNALLSLDEDKEVCLSVSQVLSGRETHRKALPEPEKPPGSVPHVGRKSHNESAYPAVLEIHRAGTSPAPEGEKTVLSMSNALGPVVVHPKSIVSPDPLPGELGYKDVVFSRRSRRNFIRAPMKRDHLMGLMGSLCVSARENPRLPVGVGLLIHHVDFEAPGFYLLNLSRREFGIAVAGSLTEKMAHVCLDQAWLAHAAVHFVFMANLTVLDRAFGVRGYRYAMLEAGRMGERLYLAATALGYGCCGIGAFYDQEARQHLELNTDSRLLYLVAVGVVKGT